jgi:uncharacterized membrane protein YhhN
MDKKMVSAIAGFALMLGVMLGMALQTWVNTPTVGAHTLTCDAEYKAIKEARFVKSLAFNARISALEAYEVCKAHNEGRE